MNLEKGVGTNHLLNYCCIIILLQIHVLMINKRTKISQLFVTEFAKTVPIGTTIEIHFMA